MSKAAKRPYLPGDILTVNFPYEDQDVSKLRPAIVLNDQYIAVLFIYLTTQNKTDPYLIEVEEWRKAGLKSPTWAKIDRTALIDDYEIINRVGELSDKDFNKIFTLYRKLQAEDIRKYSLLSIKHPDGRVLQKYDNSWNCWLFPYFKTEENNKTAADREASAIIGQQIYTTFADSAIHCKYSLEHDEYSIYDHMLYKYTLESVPDFMATDEFSINGIDYKWMSFAQMEADEEIMEANDTIIAFVKKKCK